MPFLPHAVAQYPKLLEQIADERGSRAGHRNVVCGPGIRASLAFTPPRIPAGLPLHFEHDIVWHAAAVQPPRRAQSSDASADDRHRNAHVCAGCFEPSSISQAMPGQVRPVGKSSRNPALGFQREPYQSRTKLPTRQASTLACRLHSTIPV